MSDKKVFANIINGEERPAASGDVLDIIDPSTGEVYATSPNSGPEDVDAACQAAAAAFETYRWTTPVERQRFLLRLADVTEERQQLFNSPFNFVLKFLFPLLGGLGLFFVLIITLRDSADPSYGSGASIGGIGLVLILGLGLILVGLVFMAILRVRQPAYFRGETIKHESAHAMRPHDHLVS
jgi:hypothetical protein